VTLRSRCAASLALVVLLSSWATRGLCFMPGTGEPGPRDAHACCKTGWTVGRAGCCMTGADDEAPARMAAVTPLGEPAAVAVMFIGPPDAPDAGRAVPAAFRAHSPPGPFPLRI
jgi:hypothetical protein